MGFEGINPRAAESLEKFSAGFWRGGVIVSKPTPMDARKTPDALSRTLETWRLDVPRDPAFRATVWQRIQRGPEAGWGDYLRRHAALVGGVLALAMLAGAFGGRERARARTAAESAQLAAAYVQGLDARTMTMR